MSSPLKYSIIFALQRESQNSAQFDTAHGIRYAKKYVVLKRIWPNCDRGRVLSALVTRPIGIGSVFASRSRHGCSKVFGIHHNLQCSVYLAVLMSTKKPQSAKTTQFFLKRIQVYPDFRLQPVHSILILTSLIKDRFFLTTH